MSPTGTPVEQVEHTEAREDLERRLGPGEPLLGFSKGQLSISGAPRPYLLALTKDRLLLAPVGGGKAPLELTLWRENVLHLEWSPLSSSLKIHVNGGTLSLVLRGGFWKPHTLHLVEAFTNLPRHSAPTVALNTERSLAQARDLMAIGLHAAAQAQVAKLETASSADARSDIETLTHTLRDIRGGLRVGALFLIVGAVLNVALLALLALVESGLVASEIWSLAVAVTIHIVIGINLWRGRAHQWGSAAVLWAIVAAVFAVVTYAVDGVLIGLVLQLSFGASSLMVLLGRPSRIRVVSAIALYLVGYVGPFAVSILALLGALLLA